MAAMPWEFVPPTDEMNAPNTIATTTSHRMPNAARLGRKERERRGVMGDVAFKVEDGIIVTSPRGYEQP